MPGCKTGGWLLCWQVALPVSRARTTEVEASPDSCVNTSPTRSQRIMSAYRKCKHSRICAPLEECIGVQSCCTPPPPPLEFDNNDIITSYAVFARMPKFWSCVCTPCNSPFYNQPRNLYFRWYAKIENLQVWRLYPTLQMSRQHP